MPLIEAFDLTESLNLIRIDWQSDVKFTITIGDVVTVDQWIRCLNNFRYSNMQKLMLTIRCSKNIELVGIVKALDQFWEFCF